MLVQALGITENDLTAERIKELVDSGLTESPVLELKRQPIESAKFARRAAAMANNNGGVIMIGVPDEKASDRTLHPISFEPHATSLERILKSRIEPALMYKTYLVPTDENNQARGLVVFEIPRQPRVPYAVTDGDRIFFDIKSGREIRALTEREIERMYRDRFRRDTDVETRFDALLQYDPAAPWESTNTHAYVAIVPISPVTRLFTPTLRTLGALGNLGDQHTRSLAFQHFPTLEAIEDKLVPIFGQNFGEQIMPRHTRAGFKRIEISTTPFVADRLANRRRLEIHDDGAFFTYMPEYGVFDGQNEEARGGWYDATLVHDVIQALASYWVLTVAFKIPGELMIRAGIRNPNSTELRARFRYRDRGFESSSLHRSIETVMSVDVDNLVIGPRLLQTAKPLLDDLFTAFRWPECDVITSEGGLRQGAFRQEHWARYVRPWAESMGIIEPAGNE